MHVGWMIDGPVLFPAVQAVSSGAHASGGGDTFAGPSSPLSPLPEGEGEGEGGALGGPPQALTAVCRQHCVDWSVANRSPGIHVPEESTVGGEVASQTASQMYLRERSVKPPKSVVESKPVVRNVLPALILRSSLVCRSGARRI